MKRAIAGWVALVLFGALPRPSVAVDAFRLALEAAKIGELPAGWSTAKTGEGPGGVWAVVEDATAPEGKALAQTSDQGPNPLFCLCIADGTSFKDFDLTVSFKAVAGKRDQGGGPVWRYRDANNYYIARMNPLEDNYRVYKVVNGKRTQLGSADVKIPAGEWQTLRVVHNGDRIRCYLGDRLHLDVNDETFKDAGKVGLWTKADAQTRFAGLRVTTPAQSPPEEMPRTKAAPEAQSGAFLFSYFRGNGEDGLHLASSRDGCHWTALNQGRSFLAPQVGSKLMRDPSLVQGPDGDFHLVWTTGWGDRVIGYASSRDLVEWSPQQAIPVMTHESAARNAWAPELFYDEDQKQFLIFWSTTIPGRFPETDGSGDDGWNHRIYSTTTRDFKSFAPTRLFFDGGFNVIDATILKAGKQFCLIVKDETKTRVKKNLRIARSAHAEGPYLDVSAPISISWVEGPSAIQIGDEFLVYFDHYAAPQYYGALRSKDLVQWEDISQTVKFPEGARHGTVLRVSEEVVTKLQES